MAFNPVYSFFNTIKLILQRKIYLPKGRLGSTISLGDGQEFTIFREVKIRGKSTVENSDYQPAVFRVRFLLSGMKVENNKRFSWIPVPFFVGLPGFQAKIWSINYQNNYFQGIYQWDSLEHAQQYSKSFAYRFMSNRSIEGSVSFEIIPNTSLKEYTGLL